MKVKELSKILIEYDYEDIDVELWKDIDIPNLKYNYQISNYGRARNKDTGSIIKPYFIYEENNKQSRARITMHTFDKNIPIKVLRYRLVAKAFIFNDDPKHKIEVDHLDGDRTNDHYTNLEWVTPEENKRRETIKNQRVYKSGELSARSIWSDIEVDYICQLMFVHNIHDVHTIWIKFIEYFNESTKTENQIKNLYYNITHKSRPKWKDISSKYKK